PRCASGSGSRVPGTSACKFPEDRMYESYDPRSRLSPQAAAKPAAAATGFAAAEYVKFGALPPAETTRGSRTWYGRGQNFVVAYSEVEPGARFERRGQKDEYMLFLPEQGEGARIEAGGEAVDIPGYTLAIVPPGDSVVTLRQAGVLVRVFSAVNADLAEKAANADGYATAHPRSEEHT